MTVLGIETSGKTASAAVCTEERVLAQTSVYTRLTHSQVILPICKEVLAGAGLELSDVDVFAAAAGPGSYTGLRIGIAAVKGICFALEKPCVGVSTLESLAYNVSVHKGMIIPIMAARQNLVYAAVFRSDGVNVERTTEDKIVPIEELRESLAAYDEDIITVGDGAGRLDYPAAPPSLRLQLASSLCAAAFRKEPYPPDRLEAAYLQLTQAEQQGVPAARVTPKVKYE